MNCKVVCKHWLSVLMTDVYFKKDRHLYLNHCVLEENRAPLSLFAEAPYGYNMITIGSDVVLGTDNDECWDYFGDNINYLDLAPKSLIMSAKYVKMLSSMPLIKILRVHNDAPIHAGLFGRAMEQLAEQNVKLNLEEIRIECVNCNPIKNEYFDVIPKIIEVAPKLKKIHIESILERMVPELRKVMVDYPNIKVTINLVSHSNHCLWLNEQGPLNLDGIQLEHLEFSDENSKPETVEKYLDKYPTIKGISLTCKAWPTVPIQDKVTKLDLSLRVNKDYSNVENFPKLTDLTFSSIYICVELHSPICHLEVSKLTIKTAGRFNCEQCLKAMMLSFPNITELSVEYDCIEKETLAMVLQLLSLYKNLKKFAMNGTDLRNNQLKSALDQQPEFLTLPILDLKAEISEVSILRCKNCRFDCYKPLFPLQITDEVARALCHKFVRVKYLSLKITNMDEGIASTIRTILIEIAVLKHVHFDFNFCEDEQELDAILDAFVECGQNLKTIALPFVKLDKEKVEQIFQKMPELHSISLKQMVVTRVENGQVHVKKCTEKPQSRGCSVAQPPPRRNNDDFGGFGQRHHHRDFMEAIRNRRREHHRMHLQRVEPNALEIDVNNAANRIRLHNNRRREARIRVFRRYMER